MTITIFAALVGLVGLLLYGFAPGKLGEIGKVMFGAGLVVTLLEVGPHAGLHLSR